MALALFDLDNTLLAGDSDYSWGRFLVSAGAVDGPRYEHANAQFYEAYKAGTLDIAEFLAFALEPLRRLPRPQLFAWRARFIEECVRPMIKPWVAPLLQSYRAQGATLALVTATNDFVTAPIAEILDIPHLVATVAEQRDGRFTGRPHGIPCFREGKVMRVRSWMADHGLTFTDSVFYSDSHNDLPLLEAVSRAIAVDPDPVLLATATERGWEVLRTDPPAQALLA
ncbi:histidinol-phosphatase [Acidiferrobacter thiooxydans]|uniref:HAD family hydrolase n=1 Tax=Acidiferrobacter thiooxydans TaxID=163359 RepID=A0A1C2FZM7_9GAMM|nr:HAD family hydrolase [Acidiferrobacter thiooxydans]RCN55981.1 HAD family hydrolase [Acidiferrobacter thiooxydans]UEN98748.1 HAD-IB family hydrolase [Acidiferrobacter thiooxydans]